MDSGVSDRTRYLFIFHMLSNEWLIFIEPVLFYYFWRGGTSQGSSSFDSNDNNLHPSKRGIVTNNSRYSHITANLHEPSGGSEWVAVVSEWRESFEDDGSSHHHGQ